MNCLEINPKLYLLADGELALSEEQAVRKHLTECAACRAFLTSLEQENEILSTAAAVPSWETERLRFLEKRLLRNIESERTSIWKESLGLIAQVSWLGVPAILFCLLMQAIGFNGRIYSELMRIGSETAAFKSLFPSLLFISGFMLLFILFEYCQFCSLSKKTH